MPRTEADLAVTGAVVRDRRWGGCYSGTVVRRADNTVLVAWHGTCVEDELDRDEVEVWPDAPAELADWRGALGGLDADGSPTPTEALGGRHQ